MPYKCLQPEEALMIRKRVELDQSSTHSLWNLALAYLLLGDYVKGWEYYEVRFENDDFEKVIIPTSGPRLRELAAAPRRGQPPLVVWSEQGIGDVIQFCRYLKLLDAAGIPFVFLTRPSLITLMREWTGFGDRVQDLESSDPKSDLRPHVALMSLPRLFGTELHTLPSICPYLKPPKAPPDMLRVVNPPGGISVGVVWASNPTNKAMYRNKSLPLSQLMPLFERLIDLDLIELHSLQFGTDAEQLSPWRHRHEIHEWNTRLSDFSDTAQLLRQLDLVIDTACPSLWGTQQTHLGAAQTLISAGCVNGLILPVSLDDRFARGPTEIGNRSRSARRSFGRCFCSTRSLLPQRGFYDQSNADPVC